MRISWRVSFATALLAACHKPPIVQPYAVARAAPRPITVQVRAQGVVQPAESTVILSRASGQVTDVAVQPGDAVRRGELLVRVDARTARADLAQAQASLAADSQALVTARRREAAEQQLLRDQGVTQSEYDSVTLVAATAEAAEERDAATLDNARIEVENTKVVAPSAGVVLSVDVDDGTVIPSAVSSVGSSKPLLTLADLDTVEVISPVSEKDIGKLSTGLAVRVSVDAYPDTVFAGTVTVIEPQSVQRNNETMFPVHVRLPNPDHRLKPGMNAEVSIQVGDSRDALAVPTAALRPRTDLETPAAMLGVPLATVEREATGSGDFVVFVERKGTPHALMVQTGVSDGEYTAVLHGGIVAGDSVLILPSTSLVKSQDAFQSRLKRFTSLPVAKR